MQRATHHDGARKSVVVVPWGISVTKKHVIKDKLRTAARQTCSMFRILFILTPFGVEGSAVAGHASGDSGRVTIAEVRRRGLDQRSPCAGSTCLRAGGGAGPLAVVDVGAEGELQLIGHALLMVFVIH